jgi:hypothetical protein
MRTTFLAFTLIASSAFAQDSAHPSTPLGATLSLSKGQGTPAPQAAAPAAQVDSRFAAWLGCWRLDDDLAGTGARMCITPDNGGVRLQTVIGTQKGIDELVIPDGVARPITDAECKGTERADWSKDGARVFRITEVTCGKEPARTIKAAVFMAPGPTWINVQHISGQAANTSVRVQRYRRSANQTLADGSRAPQPDLQLVTRTSPETTTWSIADVIDASGYLPLEAMQAVLTEVHHPFDLNKKTLVTLADGGVTDQVIDLMVALTYPKRFVVERPGGASTAGLMTGGGFLDPFMTPLHAVRLRVSQLLQHVRFAVVSVQLQLLRLEPDLLSGRLLLWWLGQPRPPTGRDRQHWPAGADRRPRHSRSGLHADPPSRG